jgi:hypothetical protein
MTANLGSSRDPVKKRYDVHEDAAHWVSRFKTCVNCLEKEVVPTLDII